MKHNYFLGLVLGGLLTSSGVQAQDPINKLGDSGLYGEVGYIPLTVRFENGAFIKPELVNLKIGVTFNENLSLEGIAATTVKENRGASVDMIGMFLKPTQYRVLCVYYIRWFLYRDPRANVHQGTKRLRELMT